jgi:P27 family predicted phage terminase small subunit
MARPREPINLLEAKARKHLTKAEIEERRENEVKAPSDKIRAPSYLTADLKREFNILAKQLIDVGIMTNLDVDALARFIIARSMYITLSMQIIKQPNILMSDKYPQIAINQDKAFRQCSASARDLGLTISSRCKLIVPKAGIGKDDEISEMFD